MNMVECYYIYLLTLSEIMLYAVVNITSVAFRVDKDTASGCLILSFLQMALDPEGY